MRRLTSEAFLLALLATCTFVPSCSVYDSGLLVSSDAASDTGTVDASLDSSADWNGESAADTNSATDTAQETLASDVTTDTTADGNGAETQDPRYCDTCKDTSLRRPPCPPLTSDSASLPGTLVFAARTVRMGANPNNADDWRTIGFDQDCMATDSTGQPLSCKRPSTANMTEDGDEGRDNSFAKNFGGELGLLVKFGILDTSPETDGNQRFELGLDGVLFVMSDFNGTSNDPSLTFTFYIASNTRDTVTGDYRAAQWDGSDSWTIDPDSVSPGGQALYVDDSAYVTDNTLVANLPNGLILKVQGSSSTMTLQLNEPRIIGTLTPDHKSFSEVVLSGVWQTENALISLDTFTQEKGICPGSGSYDLAHELVKNSSDIRLDLKPSPDKDCNAISIAMTFTAFRANLGTIGTHQQSGSSACADASVADTGATDASTSDSALADSGSKDSSVDAGIQDAGGN